MDNNISQMDKEDETRECCSKGACEYKPKKPVSDDIIPHILNLYGSCATPRDFEIYAPNASFEDPLMCAHGVKQIKSAFYSVSKVFSESRIVEYSVKEKATSAGKQEILIDSKQHYKFLGRNIDMISLIKIYVEDGKVVRHEDWWDKKPIGNRETIKFPLVGHLLETLRRGSMLATHSLMGFGKDPSTYQSTLEQLFQEFESSGETGSQLATVTMRIMQALQTNLDGKSKQYRDPALTHLFLMNNIHYMVRSVRRSEAKDLLGDDWVQRHRRVVQQHANQYKRNAWSKILQCLSTQGLTSSAGGGSAVPGEGGSGSGASRGLIKDRFKTFNIQFEELHQKQSQWTVPDTELRESLILAVAEVLLPAYRSFIKRFGPLVESGKNPQKFIRYTAEDLERMLGEFFEGKTLNEPRR